METSKVAIFGYPSEV